MRVQLVQEAAQEALESLRPEDPDLSELNYAGAEENPDAFSGIPAQQTPAPIPDGGGNGSARRRMTAGPPQNDDRPLNRAERRKQSKR